MAVVYSGTEVVTTTEWSLTTDTAGPDETTAPGTYQLWLDLSALQNGDIYRVRFYRKILSGGTQRASWEAIFAHALSEPHPSFPALIMDVGWDITIAKVSGTDRSISWTIDRP